MAPTTRRSHRWHARPFRDIQLPRCCCRWCVRRYTPSAQWAL